MDKRKKNIYIISTICIIVVGFVIIYSVFNLIADQQTEINNEIKTNTNANQQESNNDNSLKEDNNNDIRKLSGNKISINVDGKSFSVELYDNPTADDLLSQLPLTLNASDYAGYDEKVIQLKSNLSMEGAPAGDEPLIPEVGYYEPGNWIAIYYGYIGYWSGKVPLGRIDASIEELEAIPDGSTVTIELIE